MLYPAISNIFSYKCVSSSIRRLCSIESERQIGGIGCTVISVRRGARQAGSQAIKLCNNVVPVRGMPQMIIIGTSVIFCFDCADNEAK